MKEKIRAYRPLISGFCIWFVVSLYYYGYIKSAIANGAMDFIRVEYLCFIGLILCFLTVFYLCLQKKIRTEYLVSIGILLLGIAYLYVFRGLSAPDEVSHFVTSYKISSQIMGKEAVDASGYVYLDNADAYLVSGDTGEEYIIGQELEYKTYALLHQLDEVRRTEGVQITKLPPVNTTPLIYIPQVLGICIGRILSLNIVWILNLAKLMNLCFYAILIGIAVRMLPIKKGALALITMLPMSIHLAASLSYDAMLMGLISVFIAKILEIRFSDGSISVADMLILCMLVMIATPCKLVYAPAVALFLLIPKERFGVYGHWKKYICFAMLLVSCIMAMYIINMHTISSYAMAEENTLVWAGESGYTLRELLHRPTFAIDMGIQTILYKGEFYILSMLGAYLSGLDYVLNTPGLLLLPMLILIALQVLRKEKALGLGERVYILCIVAGIIGAIFLSMFIAWTPRTASFIEGVQGRYFLPVLWLLAVCMENRFLVSKPNPDSLGFAIYAFLCMQGLNLIRLFATICIRM